MRKRRKDIWKPTGPTMVCGACQGVGMMVRNRGKEQEASPCGRCIGRGKVEIQAVQDRRLKAAGE